MNKISRANEFARYCADTNFRCLRIYLHKILFITIQETNNIRVTPVSMSSNYYQISFITKHW